MKAYRITEKKLSNKDGDQKRGLCNLMRITHRDVQHSSCRLTRLTISAVVYFNKNLGEMSTSVR